MIEKIIECIPNYECYKPFLDCYENIFEKLEWIEELYFLEKNIYPYYHEELKESYKQLGGGPKKPKRNNCDNPCDRTGCITKEITTNQISEESLIYQWFVKDSIIAENILFSEFNYNIDSCRNQGLHLILENIINSNLNKLVGTKFKSILNILEINKDKIINYILTLNINKIYFLIICCLQLTSDEGWVGWLTNSNPNDNLYILLKIIFDTLKDYGLEAPCSTQNEFIFDDFFYIYEIYDDNTFEYQLKIDNVTDVYKRIFLINLNKFSIKFGEDINEHFTDKKFDIDGNSFILNIDYDLYQAIEGIEEIKNITINNKNDFCLIDMKYLKSFEYCKKFIRYINNDCSEDIFNNSENNYYLKCYFLETIYDNYLIKKKIVGEKINIYDIKKKIYNDGKIIIHGNRFYIEYGNYTTLGWSKSTFYFKDCKDFELADNNVILIKMEEGYKKPEYRSVENFNKEIIINKIISLLYYLKYKNLQIS